LGPRQQQLSWLGGKGLRGRREVGLARLSGNAADAEVIAFTPTKRLDFGGYSPTVDVNCIQPQLFKTIRFLSKGM
jgi:hypothetical protein